MSHTSLRSLEKKSYFEKTSIKNICIDIEGAQIRLNVKKYS